MGADQGGFGSRRRSPRLPRDHGGRAFPRPRPERGGDLHASERRAPAVGGFLPPCLPPPWIVAHELHPAQRAPHRPQRHGVLAARPLQNERALPWAGRGRRLGGEVELHSRVASVRRVGTDAGDHPVPVLQLAALASGSGEDEAEADAVVGSGREHEAGPAARLEGPDAHHGDLITLLFSTGKAADCGRGSRTSRLDHISLDTAGGAACHIFGRLQGVVQRCDPSLGRSLLPGSERHPS